MDGHLFVQRATGVRPVFPGHPLVIATVIMELYPNFEQASARTQWGWAKAVGDSRVPGGGDNVRAAMSLLKLGADGKSVHEMIRFGDTYWAAAASSHPEAVEAGQAQALAIEPAFLKRAARWFHQAVPA